MASAQSDKIEAMEREQREGAEGQVVGREDGDVSAVHRTALILLFALVALAPAATIYWGMSGFVAVYMSALAAWWWVQGAAPSARAIVVIAIALRLPLLFAPPQLSADVYRYLWDGSVSRSGTNPYLYAPSDEVLAPLRAEWHPRINHSTIRTIYPPLAQALFAVTPSLLAWRLLIVAGEVLLLVMLARRSSRSAFAYATFPLVLFEGVWSGHLDVVAGVSLAAAFLTGAPWLLALAGGLKIVPLAAAPAIVLQSRSRLRAAGVIAVVVLLPALAFLISGPLMPGFRDYAARWEFNSPAFVAAEWVASVLPLKELWTAIKDPLRLETISPLMYSLLTTSVIARVLLAFVAVTVIWWRRKSALDCVGSLLLLSPTIHPWYWLSLTALALHRRSAWVAFAAAAPASYLLYDGANGVLVMLFCYGLPAALLIARLRTSTIAS